MKTLLSIILTILTIAGLFTFGIGYIWLGSWLISGIFATTFTAVQFLKLNAAIFFAVTIIKLLNR